MTITQHGSDGAVSTGATNANVTPAFDASPSAGDFCVLYALGNGNTTAPAAPTGWTRLTPKSMGSGGTVTVFLLLALGGDANPTLAAVASTAWTAMIRRFSSVAQSVTADGALGSGSGTVSPTTAACGNADTQTGNLVIGCGGAHYGSNTANVGLATTLSTVDSTREAQNNASSVSGHYSFTWGISTQHASADAASMAMGTAPSSSGLIVVSFAPAALVSTAGILAALL